MWLQRLKSLIRLELICFLKESFVELMWEKIKCDNNLEDTVEKEYFLFLLLKEGFLILVT